MGSGLLCCVALCLLGAGCADSGVMQTPKYLIQFKGQQATLRCSPVSGHLSVYWYQQKRDQSPQFLIQYYGGEEREKGNIPDRFSVMLLSDSSSELILSALELGDSGLFLCASSLAQHCVVSSLLCKNICLYSGSDQEGGAASQPGSGPGKSQVFPRLLLLLTSVISLMLTVLAPGAHKTPPFCQAPAMILAFLCYVAFCLLQAGPGNAGIMQTPKSQVLKTGQRMTLNCAQDLKHDSMFWYRQDPGLGLRLIYYSYDVNITEKGEVPDGYSVSRLSTDNFSLTLESATPSQTSTYFCASSYSTVLRSCLCSAH